MQSAFDAEAYWRTRNCPWTFFAFPSRLADDHGLPPDEDAKRLLVELRTRGIQVGIWANGIANDTTYFACPKEEIQRLHDALSQLEADGSFEKGFCGKRSEYLFSLVAEGTQIANPSNVGS
jgi:hypothetical protein